MNEPLDLTNHGHVVSELLRLRAELARRDEQIAAVRALADSWGPRDWIANQIRAALDSGAS